jgi:hypothetical protein
MNHVGTAALGCPAARRRGSLTMDKGKPPRSFAPPDSRGGCLHVAGGGPAQTIQPMRRVQLTQSRNLYQAPAKGRNQGLPL